MRPYADLEPFLASEIRGPRPICPSAKGPSSGQSPYRACEQIGSQRRQAPSRYVSGAKSPPFFTHFRLPRLFPRADRKRRGGTRSKEVGGGLPALYLLRSTSPPPACPPRIIEIEQLPGEGQGGGQSRTPQPWRGIPRDRLQIRSQAHQGRSLSGRSASPCRSRQRYSARIASRLSFDGLSNPSARCANGVSTKPWTSINVG